MKSQVVRMLQQTLLLILASMEVGATESELRLDTTESTGFPSKTAETTAQYSDSSSSVK